MVIRILVGIVGGFLAGLAIGGVISVSPAWQWAYIAFVAIFVWAIWFSARRLSRESVAMLVVAAAFLLPSVRQGIVSYQNTEPRAIVGEDESRGLDVYPELVPTAASLMNLVVRPTHMYQGPRSEWSSSVQTEFVGFQIVDRLQNSNIVRIQLITILMSAFTAFAFGRIVSARSRTSNQISAGTGPSSTL
jgi:hypothetical protein